MSKVLATLHELLPESQSIKSDFYLTADSLFQVLAASGLDVQLTLIPHFESGDWDDEQLAKIIFSEREGFHASPFFVHTPACSRYELPDFEGSSLAQFIEGYRREMLFDGDVVFVSLASKTLTVFHHEGAFAHFTLSA